LARIAASAAHAGASQKETDHDYARSDSLESRTRHDHAPRRRTQSAPDDAPGNEPAFDDVLRGFGPARFAGDGFSGRSMGWPNIEVSETDKDVKVVAELPGLEEKDVEIGLADGLLSIKGEKKTEIEDKDRLFSERYYGRFERRIPVDDVDEEKVSAAFKNGVLTLTMPKAPQAQSKVKRIAINVK